MGEGLIPDLGQFVDYVWNLKAERDTLRQQLAERDATIERLEAGIPRLQEHAHQMRQQRDRLMAENERLRKSCAGVIARSVHETRAATNSTLDGYLAAGIAATDAELDTLRKQLDEARELGSCAAPK